MITKTSISERSVGLSANASFLLIYLQEFGEDIFPDLLDLMSSSMAAVVAAVAYQGEPSEATAIALADAIGRVDTEKCQRLIWSLAKNADESLPHFDDWVAEYTGMNVISTMVDVVRFLHPTLTATVKAKSKQGGKTDGAFSTHLIMVAITARGMSVSDMERFTVGQCVDFVIEWNNLHVQPGKERKEPVRRRAKQADWDNFR